MKDFKSDHICEILFDAPLLPPESPYPRTSIIFTIIGYFFEISSASGSMVTLFSEMRAKNIDTIYIPFP